MAPEEKAYFALGCFWHPDEYFSKIPGVLKTTVGYAGGTTKDPTYHSLGDHAETIEVVFDPHQISYGELLGQFWRSHDPTTPNRQGADIGSQYRSMILYNTDQQRKEAEASKDRLEKMKAFAKPIVTEVKPLDSFYIAEDYHQKYLQKNRGAVC